MISLDHARPDPARAGSRRRHEPPWPPATGRTTLWSTGEFPFTAADFRHIARRALCDVGHSPARLEGARWSIRAWPSACARSACAASASTSRWSPSDRRQATSAERLLMALTTNVTRFFREPHHFDHLIETAADAAAPTRRRPGGRVRIWSSACSTGQEPYSIALAVLSVLPDAARARHQDPGDRHRPQHGHAAPHGRRLCRRGRSNRFRPTIAIAGSRRTGRRAPGGWARTRDR